MACVWYSRVRITASSCCCCMCTKQLPHCAHNATIPPYSMSPRANRPRLGHLLHPPSISLHLQSSSCDLFSIDCSASTCSHTCDKIAHSKHTYCMYQRIKYTCACMHVHKHTNKHALEHGCMHARALHARMHVRSLTHSHTLPYSHPYDIMHVHLGNSCTFVGQCVKQAHTNTRMHACTRKHAHALLATST